MNNNTLNPDAVEASAAAARIDWSGRTDWDGAPNSVQIAYRNIARAAVSAYISATWPVVSNLEELEALSPRTVAMFTMPMLEKQVPFELDSRNGDDKYWEQPGDPAGYKSSVMAHYLPATVIYTPDVAL